MIKNHLAVAGLLAAVVTPAPSLAQSTVTITGYFKASIEHLQLGNTAKSPSGEVRVADNSSRMYFRVSEDLGGGLSAIGQYEFRPGIDTGALTATGANWVGLRSATLGSVKFGRADLHYQNEPSKIRSRSGSFKTSPVSLLAFAGGGGTAIAANSRTPNVLLYESPAWSGLALAAAYSSSPAGADGDIASGARMWALAYNYDLSKRTAVGLSYARIRNDAGAFYNLDGSAGANGSPSGAVIAGENPRLWAFTVFHAF